MGSITTTSRGQYLLGAKTLLSKDIQLNTPESDEVQIVPRSTTLCGSDLHYHDHGRNGSILVKEPLCLGHESAGEIVLVGSEVTGIKVGDRVAIECGVPCMSCDICFEGRYNLCPTLRFRGSGSAFPHFQGTLQERINHPARWVHKLPDQLSFDDGALLEPLSVACHAVRRAQISAKSTCLVLGAGPVGLLCAAVARYHGCSQVVICDIDQPRVSFAIREGFADAGHVVARRSAQCVEEEMNNARILADEISSQVWPDGRSVGRSSVVFECTGVPSCVQTSIFSAKSGGRVMLVGMGTPNHTLPLAEAAAREIDLMPTWRYAHCYEEAMQIMAKVAEGVFAPDVRRLITHRFSGLGSVQHAFALANSPQDPDGKLVIKVAVTS